MRASVQSFDRVLPFWLVPGLRLPGSLRCREGSIPLAAVAPTTARQTHASLEYLRRNAGLGQDKTCQAVSYAASCRA